MDAMDNQMFTKEKGSNETGNISKELDSGVKENEVNQIRSHLQNLEVELASVLGLLRSRTDAIVLHKVGDLILVFYVIYYGFYYFFKLQFSIQIFHLNL